MPIPFLMQCSPRELDLVWKKIAIGTELDQKWPSGLEQSQSQTLFFEIFKMGTQKWENSAVSRTGISWLATQKPEYMT
jgi:hypothetical protein